MENKLPKIFKKNVTSDHINNIKTFSTNSSVDKKINSINDDNSLTVEDKIKKLFKSTRYIFNIGVIIKTNKKEYDTKIIGKVKNSLITVDDETIPIIEIEDIVIKDRV